MLENYSYLQVACTFFFGTAELPEVNAKAAARTKSLFLENLELFDSEDPRENETNWAIILMHLRGKLSHRSLSDALLTSYRFVYETERHNGIGELLET
jgi:serine/threonine-protein phosphatase 2A regulatory subunit B'